MRYSQDPERQRILIQALDATTLYEIDVATRELKQWVSDHPDDLGIVDAFEQLIYDLDQLVLVYDLSPASCYEFACKNPDEKRRALLGVIKILS